MTMPDRTVLAALSREQAVARWCIKWVTGLFVSGCGSVVLIAVLIGRLSQPVDDRDASALTYAFLAVACTLAALTVVGTRWDTARANIRLYRKEMLKGIREGQSRIGD